MFEEENEKLRNNLTTLYSTAKHQLERKENTIQQLQKKLQSRYSKKRG